MEHVELTPHHHLFKFPADQSPVGFAVKLRFGRYDDGSYWATRNGPDGRMIVTYLFLCGFAAMGFLISAFPWES